GTGTPAGPAGHRGHRAGGADGAARVVRVRADRVGLLERRGVPGAGGEHLMADPKPAPKKPEPPPPPLGDAGASSDPAGHQLLAQRDAAAANGDEDTVAALTARLAELGVQ